MGGALLRQETFVVRIYGPEGKRKEPRGVVEIVRRRILVPFDSFAALKKILVEHSLPLRKSEGKSPKG